MVRSWYGSGERRIFPEADALSFMIILAEGHRQGSVEKGKRGKDRTDTEGRNPAGAQ